MVLSDALSSAFYYCSQCHIQLQQRYKDARARSRLRSQLQSRSRECYSLPFLATAVLLLSTLTTNITQAQTSSPLIYTPRHSAGSSIANNTLFIISGTASVSPPYSATTDTLAISLNKPFNTGSIPWRRLQGGYSVHDARVAATVDEKHLVLAGVRDQGAQIVTVYTLESNTWTTLPPTALINASPQAPRTSVGIATDKETGLMVLYGGTSTTAGTSPASNSYSLSFEFDFLDTRPILEKWSWSAVVDSNVSPPGLHQPITLYLPTHRATLIMGGCNGINLNNGNITQCASFTSGYLVNSKLLADTKGTSAPVSQVSMRGFDIPLPRLSPCAAVLANGDVFMYGGTTVNGSLGDVWVLNTNSWMWTSKNIVNMPFAGRAGATCQLAAADQLIVVGGFDGALTGPRQFSLPQVAIINTTSWEWISTFTPPLTITTTPPKGLAVAVIIGITAGSCFLIAVFCAGVGYLILRRREKRFKSHKEIFKAVRASKSQEPLMSSDTSPAGSEPSSTPMIPFRITYHPNQSNSESISQVSLRSKERQPFLIIPFAPDNASTSTINLSTTDTADMSSTIGNNTIMMSAKQKNDEGIGASNDLYSKGYQLPQTLADIQHVQYVKTLQHQKQYERRMREMGQRQAQGSHHRLHRQGTHHTILRQGENDDNNDGVDLATSVIQLKEIDVGEEPMMGSWNNIEDDTMLLSSHLDTSKLNINPF
ncbi:hypothetical protein BX616_006815 [Lobosporangium transversale]|uniref:Galactose oxidase n=1 Tax=Lobosporangium transversale TaxID=64571 RepID=A0A1Y2G5E6_9FUNG|nr:hypothetical protein BCR41DRAFT_426868 [Lobosporangium transversale]KAF9915145.1 hypothetical protein BX616_006815 [Lobosporangium transversale]ORY95146.1 hypothetical protein BCR41DRAFT_426868 [Lobosporangium transversale]|eukprot:XP_021875353.1 hypothetical protein BCR41DRAFT_426868 [Lobosporangium transversale]